MRCALGAFGFRLHHAPLALVPLLRVAPMPLSLFYRHYLSRRAPLPVKGQRPSCVQLRICWAQLADRLSLQTATLGLQTGRFKRPVCRLYATQAWFTNRNPVCKLR